MAHRRKDGNFGSAKKRRGRRAVERERRDREMVMDYVSREYKQMKTSAMIHRIAIIATTAVFGIAVGLTLYFGFF